VAEGAKIRHVSVLEKIRNPDKGLGCGIFVSLPHETYRLSYSGTTAKPLIGRKG
jgi:hypothetical protein